MTSLKAAVMAAFLHIPVLYHTIITADNGGLLMYHIRSEI